MTKMTTQEMIDWLQGMIRGPYGDPCEKCIAIAARLKALEGMRSEVTRFQAEMHDDKQRPGVPVMACADIAERLSAILETVREV